MGIARDRSRGVLWLSHLIWVHLAGAVREPPLPRKPPNQSVYMQLSLQHWREQFSEAVRAHERTTAGQPIQMPGIPLRFARESAYIFFVNVNMRMFWR